MRCDNHPNAPAMTNCESCEKPLCGMCANFTPAGIFCERCNQNQEAERFVENKVSEMDALLADGERQQIGVVPEQGSGAKDTKQGNRLLVLSFTLLLPLYVSLLAYSNPGILDFNSIERTRQEAAHALEDCLYIFQEIGMYLEEGLSPPPTLRCEEVSSVNIFTRNGSEVRVSHPNPQFHGYRQIYVTNHDHEPVLVR